MLKYNEVKEHIKLEIRDMEPGACLPNRNALAKKYSVARTTLERAISELIGEGYLLSRDGSGTYVAETREAVEASANPTLRTAGSPLWALLISNILYDIYPPIVRAVEDEAHARGINLIICNTDNRCEKQNKYVRQLLDGGTTGIAIIPAIDGEVDVDLWNEVFGRGVHVVACVRPLGNYLTPGVYVNSFQAGFLATNHLIERGCRHIAYLSSILYASSLDRFQGYLAALDMHGLPYDETLVTYEPGRIDAGAGEQRAFELLSRHPEIDGIYAFNDRVAMGAVNAMDRLGLMPGRDIKIVGTDDTDICRSMPVRLTSANIQADQIGKNAADMLYRLHQGLPLAQRQIVLNAKLHVRESTVSAAEELTSAALG